MKYFRSGFCVILCAFMVMSCTKGSAQTKMNTRDYDDGKIDEVNFNGKKDHNDRYANKNQRDDSSNDNRDQNYNDRKKDDYSSDKTDMNNKDDNFQVRDGNSDDKDDSLKKKSYFQTGIASWYGREFHGKITASGEKFDMYEYTAAHKTLPFGTIVEVKNLNNGRVIRVKVNDRGPYRGKRIIDLSFKAAQKLHMIGPGKAMVGVTVLKTGDGTYVRNNGSGKKIRPVDFDTKGLNNDDQVNDGSSSDSLKYSKTDERNSNNDLNDSDKISTDRDSSNDYSNKGEKNNSNDPDYNVRNDSRNDSDSYTSKGSDGRYALQAGAFYSRRNAQKLKDKIEKHVQQPVIVIKDGDFYKVRVKGFRTKHDANKYKKILRSEDVKTYTVEE